MTNMFQLVDCPLNIQHQYYFLCEQLNDHKRWAVFSVYQWDCFQEWNLNNFSPTSTCTCRVLCKYLHAEVVPTRIFTTTFIDRALLNNKFYWKLIWSLWLLIEQIQFTWNVFANAFCSNHQMLFIRQRMKCRQKINSTHETRDNRWSFYDPLFFFPVQIWNSALVNYFCPRASYSYYTELNKSNISKLQKDGYPYSSVSPSIHFQLHVPCTDINIPILTTNCFNSLAKSKK